VKRPSWMLRPEDLAWNPPEPEPVAPESTLPLPPVEYANPCPHRGSVCHTTGITCERSFPTQASLARHIEFDHPTIHEDELDRLRREAREAQEAREADECVRAYEPEPHTDEKPLPPWEREV
jgi:hypothetical protein